MTHCLYCILQSDIPSDYLRSCVSWQSHLSQLLQKSPSVSVQSNATGQSKGSNGLLQPATRHIQHPYPIQVDF
jgi:hypothetical protein